MKKIDHLTPNGIYKNAIRYTEEAADIEDNNGDQDQADNLWDMAVSDFWQTLVLGHPEAPYSLSCCFNQGVGVKKDEYLAKLFFGVALALDDPKCQRETNKQIIPIEMKEVINGVVALIQEAQNKIDLNVDMFENDGRNLITQFQIFDNYIKLPHLPSNIQITDLINQGAGTTAQNLDHHQDSNFNNDHKHETEMTGAQHYEDDSSCCIIL